MTQDHQGAGVHAKVYSENAHVPFGSGCPLLTASWLNWAWLQMKPFCGGNFHTTVNSVRWLKTAQFVVWSHCCPSSLIFSRPLKLRAADSNPLFLKCPSLQLSFLVSAAMHQECRKPDYMNFVFISSRLDRNQLIGGGNHFCHQH